MTRSRGYCAPHTLYSMVILRDLKSFFCWYLGNFHIYFAGITYFLENSGLETNFNNPFLKPYFPFINIIPILSWILPTLIAVLRSWIHVFLGRCLFCAVTVASEISSLHL